MNEVKKHPLLFFVLLCGALFLIVGILAVWHVLRSDQKNADTLVIDPLTSVSPTPDTSDTSVADTFLLAVHASPSAPSATLPVTIPTGYMKYASEEYGFSLYHPGELSVHGYDEGGGAATIIFQDIKTVQGFQVFIVPYGEKQVTEERFVIDQPSGVFQEPQQIFIDGVSAIHFYGRNALLGTTSEVWFTHDGYLFEVTAPRALDAWLATVMQTWQFTD